MKLRAPEPDDVNNIYIWENSSDEAHSSLRTGPLSRRQIAAWVENYDGDIYTSGSQRYMIDADDGTTVGTIDVFDFDKRARHAFVGIFIDPARRRQGFARKALDEVCLRMERDLTMYALAALIAEDNTPSKALFTVAGFAHVGTLPGWINDGERRIDALLYVRQLNRF